MEQTNNRKLVASAVLVVASVALLLGLTFAWFTDSVVNKGNKIQAGTLQLSAVSQALDMENGATVVADSGQIIGKGTELKFGAGTDLKEASGPIIDDALWEPGISNAKLLTVSSGESSLSMKVKLSLTAQGDLTDALWFDFVRVEGGAVTGRFDPCTWDEAAGEGRTRHGIRAQSLAIPPQFHAGVRHERGGGQRIPGYELRGGRRPRRHASGGRGRWLRQRRLRRRRRLRLGRRHDDGGRAG